MLFVPLKGYGYRVSRERILEPEHFVMLPLALVPGWPFRDFDDYDTSGAHYEEKCISKRGTVAPGGLNSRHERTGAPTRAA